VLYFLTRNHTAGACIFSYWQVKMFLCQEIYKSAGSLKATVM